MNSAASTSFILKMKKIEGTEKLQTSLFRFMLSATIPFAGHKKHYQTTKNTQDTRQNNCILETTSCLLEKSCKYKKKKENIQHPISCDVNTVTTTVII